MLNKNLLLLSLIIIILFSGCKSKKPVVERPSKPPVAEVPKEIPEESKVEVEVIEQISEEVKANEEVPSVQKVRTSPPVRREFRAAWVATVANINWPSKPGLSSKEQQQEAIKLLDLLTENGHYPYSDLDRQPVAPVQPLGGGAMMLPFTETVVPEGQTPDETNASTTSRATASSGSPTAHSSAEAAPSGRT